MPVAFYILFGAAFTVAVAAALGRLLLAGLHGDLRAGEHWILGFAVGSACLSLLVFGLAAAGVVHKAVFLVCGIGILGFAGWRGALRKGGGGHPEPSLSRTWKVLFGIVFAAFAVLYLFTAMLPEHSADGATYHLGPVARYVRAHGFERIETDMRANLSQGAEMLYLFAFAFGRHSSAALVHCAFLLALPAAIFAYGRRFGMPFAGAAGALIAFVAPVVGMDGTCAYIDVAMAFSLFALFYVLQVWDERRDAGLLAAAGLLGGFCFAIKYTGLTGMAYALGFVGWRLLRGRKPLLKPLAVLACCGALIAVPWVARTWIWFENPAWPFLNNVFPNPYMHLSLEREWSHNMRHYEGLRSDLDIPLEVTVRGRTLAGLAGPLFLLIPIALLALRSKHGRRLIFAGALFGSPFVANVGTRFLIPAIPFLSLALAIALAQYRGVLGALVLAHAVTAWPPVMHKYSAKYPWALERFPSIKEALRLKSEDAALLRFLPSYAIVRLIEEKVPPGARVFAFEQLPDAYTSRQIVVSYQGAFNEGIADLLRIPWPPVQYRFHFPARSLTGVRVVETQSASTGVWSVTELRVLANGAERLRQSGWRLRARPNPWDAALAFDENPVTRWRTWEPVRAGMFLGLDFDNPEAVDEIRIDTTTDCPGAALKVEGRLPSGEWAALPAVPQQVELSPPEGVRRMATAEAKRRGVSYFVITTENYWADQFIADPGSWGLTQIGERGKYRLYRAD